MAIAALLEKHALNAITALLFGLAFWRIGLSPELPAGAGVHLRWRLLSVIDWKVHRLPTRLVYLTLAAVAGGLLFASLVEWEWKSLATAVAGAMLFSGAFFAIWFVTQQLLGFFVLGFGDVRLATVLGAVLGWYGLNYVLYGAIIGHLLAVGLGVASCIRKRRIHVTNAFGPPLIAGALMVVLFHV